MHAASAHDERRRGGVVHEAQRVAEAARRVHDALAAHVEGAPRLHVAHGNAARTALRVLEHALHGDVVGNRGALLCCGERDHEVHAAVVVRAVVVHDAAAEALRLEHRELVHRLVARHIVRGRHEAARARDQVVHLRAEPHVRHLPPRVDGDQRRKRVRHVRRRVQQVRALLQRFSHEQVVPPIQVLERGLQVADAPVDELGAAPRRAARVVVALHERDLEPARRRLPSHARAHAAATHDDEVKLLVSEALQLLRARRRCPRRHCRPVFASNGHGPAIAHAAAAQRRAGTARQRVARAGWHPRAARERAARKRAARDCHAPQRRAQESQLRAGSRRRRCSERCWLL